MLKGDCNKCIHHAADPADKVCVECGIARKNYEERTMTKYIDHEALIDALMSYSWRDENDFSIDDADEKRKFIEGWLPNISAADVAPVVHAHWEDVSVDDEGSMLIASMFCSNCKRWHNEVYHYGSPTEMAHYCPHCGARIDEVIDDA